MDAGVAELVAARAEDDSPGLVAGSSEWTWRQVVAESAGRAAWLAAAIDPSRPPNVGLLLDNTPDFVFTLFGAALAGATIVGINSTRRGPELQRDVDHTECQFVLSDSAHADLLPDTVPVESAPWARYAGAAVPDHLPDPSSLLLLIFTSGSTSAPKAVRRSSGRIATAAQIGFTPNDAVYVSMPLFHGNALFGVLFPGLAGGSRIVLREHFSASGWLADVRTFGVTFTSTVGRALSYILATPPTADDKDHNLRIVLAPESTPADAATFTDRFGCMVVTGYGSSEGGITLLPSRRVGALGRAPEGADVAVVDPVTHQAKAIAEFDENGRLLNPEQAIGELVRKDSHGAFEGYWNNQDADRDRLRATAASESWFWSGDLAYRDADGVFFFAGRAGDWLRVDSENFAAAPIERIIGRHPDVTAVAVVGVADPHSGDQVLAVIETARFDPDEFAGWLAEQPDLGTKWAPKFIRVTDSLPTLALDKTDRRRIRADGWQTSDVVWWKPTRDTGYQILTEADRESLCAEFVANGRSALMPGTAT